MSNQGVFTVALSNFVIYVIVIAFAVKVENKVSHKSFWVF